MMTRIVLSMIAAAFIGLLTSPAGAAETPVDPAAPAPQGASSEGASMAATVEKGSTVAIDYTLKVEGKVVDSSQGSGPLSYVHGQGQLVPGLEKELSGLKAGEKRSVTVDPESGYGAVDPNAFVEVSRAQLPPDVMPQPGQALRGMGPDGQPFRATIAKVADESVTLDLNHPLAGKTLAFDVTVVSVTPAKKP
jgi:FKBP-type peptidyl-prolyl cis-trans isomerase SlyD